MVFPVSIGDGTRVFPTEQVKQPWQLVDHRAYETGALLLIYRPS